MAVFRDCGIAWVCSLMFCSKKLLSVTHILEQTVQAKNACI